MNLKIFWLATFFPLFTLGQENNLKVGDTLPFTLIETATKGQLSDLHIQYLSEGNTILDFWATWCTSCAKGLGKLIKYKSQYPKLQVLLINSMSTGDSNEKITRFLSKQSQIWGRKCPFPYINNDTLFATLFPHRLLPHYIWLQNGKISAMTGAEAITVSNIKDFLEGRESLKSKIDIDPKRPLFINNSLPLPEIQAYAILMKGYYPGLGSGNQIRTSGNTIIGLAIKNMSLLRIYEVIAGQIIPYFNEKRIVFKYFKCQKQIALLNSKSDKNDLYNLDYIAPLQFADSLYPLMLQFVNSATNWHGSIKNQKKTVWLLNSTDSIIKKDNKKGKYPSRNFILIQSISGLVNYLNNQSWLEYPVIPEAGNNAPVAIKLPKNLSSISELQNILNKQGFTLRKSRQSIKVLQIEPIQN